MRVRGGPRGGALFSNVSYPVSFAVPLLVLALVAAPAAPAPLELTQAEAVRRALTTALSFRGAALDEQIAAEELRLASRALTPRVTLPLQWIHNSPQRGSAAAASPTQPGDHGVQSFIATNAIDEYSALATISKPFDLSGKLRAALEKSRAALAAAHAGTEVARRTLISTTTQAFHDLELASDRVRDTAAALESAHTLEGITDLLVKAGEAPEVDLLKARLQSSSRTDDLAQAEAARTVAADALRVLVGAPMALDIKPVEAALSLPDASAVDRYVATVLDTRPELAQVDAEWRSAAADYRIAAAARRPDFTFALSGGFDTDALTERAIGDHAGIQSTVGLSVPIFDAGESRIRKQQARLAIAKAEIKRGQVRRELTQQFLDARARAFAAVRRYEALRATDTDAERNLTISTTRYRSGEGDILQVTDAMAALAAHRTALAQALHDYRVAMAQLQQVAGP